MKDGEAGNFVTDLAFNGDGTKLWTASGTQGPTFHEMSTSTLAPDGITYDSEDMTHTVAWSPGHGGLLAGTAGSNLYVYAVGRSAPIAKLPIVGGNAVAAVSLSLSPDGKTAYVLTTGALWAPAAPTVQVIDLRPSISAIGPTNVVQGVPTTLTVTGSALGGTTSVSVGGSSSVPLSVAPDKVTFADAQQRIPRQHARGAEPSTGSSSTSITVLPNTGAALSGTVRRNGAAVSGAQLTLTGGPLGGPVVTQTSADGTYGYTGLAYGTTYSLAVHDPGGAPDQTIHGLTLTPNSTTTQDIELTRPLANGAELARTSIGPGTVNDLLVDPGSGDVVIAVGNEVDVLDATGAMLARFTGLYGAHALDSARCRRVRRAVDAGSHRPHQHGVVDDHRIVGPQHPHQRFRRRRRRQDLVRRRQQPVDPAGVARPVDGRAVVPADHPRTTSQS